VSHSLLYHHTLPCRTRRTYRFTTSLIAMPFLSIAG